MFAALFLAAAALAAQDADALVTSGTEKLARNDFKGAVQDFTRALELNPKRPDAALGRGKALYKLKSAAEAVEDFTRAVVLDPANTDAYFWRGMVYQDSDEHRLAVRDLTKCLELGAKNPILYERRASSLSTLGEWERAESDYGHALDADFRPEECYRGRGTIRISLGNLRGAVSDLSRSILLNPENEGAYATRFIAYYGLQSWENALRDLRRTEALGSKSIRSVPFWVYLARRRLGEQDAAAKDLKTFVEASGSEWLRRIAAYMGDEIDEQAILNMTAPEGSRKTREGEAHFFIGEKLILNGKTDDAVAHFKKTLAAFKSATTVESALARAEIEFCQFEKRRAVIEILEKRFRALGPCEVRFAIEGQPQDDAEMLRDLVLYFDMAGGTMLARFSKTDAKTGKEVEGFIEFKGTAMNLWGGDVAQRMDCTPFLEGMKDLDRKLTEELDRILPPDPANRREPELYRSHLTINVDGKPDAQHGSSFNFKFGRGNRNAASWLQEPLIATDTTIREGNGTVLFEIPTRRKKILVDAKTGFLQSLEALDFDGTPRRITVLSFKEIASFPEVKRPEKFTAMPLDQRQLLSQLTEHRGWFHAQIAEILDRWDQIEKDGKQKEVLPILTRWAARFEDSLYAYGVRAMAKRHLRQTLDLGTPASALFKDVAAETKRFAEKVAKEKQALADFLRTQIADLVYQSETDAFEAPIDNRRHGTLREILKKALDFDAVDRTRVETYGERLESLFREELEAHRQL